MGSIAEGQFSDGFSIVKTCSRSCSGSSLFDIQVGNSFGCHTWGKRWKKNPRSPDKTDKNPKNPLDLREMSGPTWHLRKAPFQWSVVTLNWPWSNLISAGSNVNMGIALTLEPLSNFRKILGHHRTPLSHRFVDRWNIKDPQGSWKLYLLVNGFR